MRSIEVEHPLEDIRKSLLCYIEKYNFSGFDPYDGLNSKVLQSTPLFKSPLVRLFWIQLFRRSPVNLRKVFGVPKGFNPKAGALFLAGVCKMCAVSGDKRYKEMAFELAGLLRKTILRRAKGIAWGYNFPWQSKAFYVPAGTPNIVTTVFVGHALMDYYEAFKDEEVRSFIGGIKDFIVNEMILWERSDRMCFGYIPGEKAEVHNANLLAAAFLCRGGIFLGDRGLNGLVLKAVRFSIDDISEEGHWPYGTMPHHRWMDNFHTAFNLEALLEIKRQLPTNEFDNAITKVFKYYLRNFFLADGTSKYYHNKLYPIDIHTIAVDLLFFTGLFEYPCVLFSEEDLRSAKKLTEVNLELAVNKFWDKRGYFYYQRNRLYMNKIPYMRWSQSWMFFALASYLAVANKEIYAKTN